VGQLEAVAGKYVAVVAANAALHNEVQDLKGSIRVFCRVRPPGATGDASPPCTSVGVDGEVCTYLTYTELNNVSFEDNHRRCLPALHQRRH